MGFGNKENGVRYYDDGLSVESTNGTHDVLITDPQLIEDDLIKIGFTDFKYYIVPCGPGDYFTNWIYFNATK